MKKFWRNYLIYFVAGFGMGILAKALPLAVYLAIWLALVVIDIAKNSFGKSSIKEIVKETGEDFKKTIKEIGMDSKGNNNLWVYFLRMNLPILGIIMAFWLWKVCFGH